MDLATVLRDNRELILTRWCERIIATYPASTSEFLGRERDRFRNPVGHAISASLGPIYDQLRFAMDKDQLSCALDPIIRIRAVQDFRPSGALAFVFQLKAVVREVSAASLLGEQLEDALTALDARIDQIALLAFDKYLECREKLGELRYNELKDQTTRLLERVNVRASSSDDVRARRP